MLSYETVKSILMDWWNDSPYHKFAFLSVAFFWGSCWGSFIQASAHRMPRGISLLYPGSRCPQCLHSLGLMDNLPIIGWINLRGMCLYCREPIPFRYLWVEILTGLLHLPLLVYVMEVADNPLAFFLIGTALISWAILITLIDAEHRYIPDLLTLGPLLFLIVFQTSFSGHPGEQLFLDISILCMSLLLPIASLDLLRSLILTLGGEKFERRMAPYNTIPLSRSRGTEAPKNILFHLADPHSHCL